MVADYWNGEYLKDRIVRGRTWMDKRIVLQFPYQAVTDSFRATSVLIRSFGFHAFALSIDLEMDVKQILLLVLLFSNSHGFQAIDTGLGRKEPEQNQHLIKDFGSLAGDNNTTSLPSNFTICSSISTADAKGPAAFFQLLGDANEPWISISVLFGGKTRKVHVIKVMVSWFLGSNHISK